MPDDMGELIAIVPRNATEDARISLTDFRDVELIDIRFAPSMATTQPAADALPRRASA